MKKVPCLIAESRYTSVSGRYPRTSLEETRVFAWSRLRDGVDDFRACSRFDHQVFFGVVCQTGPSTVSSMIRIDILEMFLTVS